MTTDSRYRNQDLWIPKPFHSEFVDRLVSRGDPRIPFERQVDLWWYAFEVGVTEGAKTPLPSRDNLVRFNDGGILESEPWRITHLELFVLAEQGEDSASNPSIVVQTANEFAVTGFRLLTKELQGAIDPQLHLMVHVASVCAI